MKCPKKDCEGEVRRIVANGKPTSIGFCSACGAHVGLDGKPLEMIG